MTQTDTNLSAFGALLKSFRKRRRLTQQQLAEAIGVHRSAVVRWEQGDYLPESKTMILELARHLSLNDQESRQLLEASLTALTPHWSVPLPRNPFFTGREEILEALHIQLSSGNQAIALTQSSALHGLGGIGKTQIALEYAYRHSLEYSAVFWIGAETEEQIASSLLRIAEVLHLPGRDSKDQQQAIAAVQRWLSVHDQWLLIWDNVEDLAVLDRFLPSVRSGTILITTRCQILGTFAQGLDLLPMKQEEGILFLFHRAKILDPQATSEHLRQFAERQPMQYEAAAELVEATGGLPLALDQAGAYIEETRCGLPAYLDLFRNQRAILLQQRGEGAREHPASVATTFILAIATTAQRHPAIWDLLRVCALLQPDAIPEELFRQGSEHLGTALGAVCRDELEWNRVVGIACSYSLLSRQPEEQTLSMHRLVQAVLLDGMTEAEREQWNKLTIESLDTVFPEARPTAEYAVWKRGERLLPHALGCLRIKMVKDSLTAASLAYKVAQYLCDPGRYAEAEPLFQRALHVRERVLGPDHLLVASSLAGLANLLQERDKYTEAELLYHRALSILEQTLGFDHLDVADLLNHLAILYKGWGKYVEAEPLYQRALHIREQHLGRHHPDVARLLNNLGLLRIEQGKYTEVEPLYQRVLSILEQTLGPDHPLMASGFHNLAVLYSLQGKYVEAEPLYLRSLHIREQTQGSNHPDTAAGFNILAELYVEQGRDAEAESLFQQALHIWERTLGPENHHVAEALNNLANLYLKQGKDVEAKLLYQRALRIREQTQGPEHPDVAEPLNNLANLYLKQGKDAEAEPLYLRALTIRERYLGQHHPETAKTLHDLAIFRYKQGNLSEAISLAEHALKIRSQSLGDAHPKIIATRILYAQLVQEQATQEGVASERGVEGLPDALRGVCPTEKAAPTLYESANTSPYEHDPLQAFLDACCELHTLASCRISDLWQTYEQWTALSQGRIPLPRRAFAAQMKARGCRTDRTSTERIWRGITLVDRNQ